MKNKMRPVPPWRDLKEELIKFLEEEKELFHVLHN